LIGLPLWKMWHLSYFALLVTVLVAPSYGAKRYGITDVEDKVVVSARVESCTG